MKKNNSFHLVSCMFVCVCQLFTTTTTTTTTTTPGYFFIPAVDLGIVYSTFQIELLQAKVR